MCFLFKNRANKKDIKESEKVFLDFLEGRILTADFWKQYSGNRILQDVLKFDKARWKKTYMLGTVKMRHYGKGPYDKIFNYNPDTLLDVVDINKLYDVYCLYCVINKYFIYRGIKPKCGNKEMQQYLFLQKLVPSYVNIDDGEYLKNIFDSTNKNLSQKERIEEARAKIKGIYRYDRVSPKWLQPPEWPKDDNGPLVFSHQKNDIGKATYYFYNNKTKKQTIVEQFE